MDSNFINDLRERIKDANERFEERNFKLMVDPANSEHYYIVDLSKIAECNVVGCVWAEKFLPNNLYCAFELYHVGDVAAEEYSVNPGYYLAISLYLP